GRGAKSPGKTPQSHGSCTPIRGVEKPALGRTPLSRQTRGEIGLPGRTCLMSRHVVAPLLWAMLVSALAIPGASSTEAAQLVYLSTNPTGQARMVSDSAACRGNETLVIFNTEGQQGPPGQQGPSGPQGPPGPANRVFSGSVSANGHPQ